MKTLRVQKAIASQIVRQSVAGTIPQAMLSFVLYIQAVWQGLCGSRTSGRGFQQMNICLLPAMFEPENLHFKTCPISCSARFWSAWQYSSTVDMLFVNGYKLGLLGPIYSLHTAEGKLLSLTVINDCVFDLPTTSKCKEQPQQFWIAHLCQHHYTFINTNLHWGRHTDTKHFTFYHHTFHVGPRLSVRVAAWWSSRKILASAVCSTCL